MMVSLRCVCLLLLAGFCSSKPLVASDEVVFAESGERVLVLPFQVEDEAIERWEGLALTLSLYDRVAAREQLVPLRAIRKKLNEYGLSLVSHLSLATRIKLARDLDADLLVYGGYTEEGFRTDYLSTRNMSLAHQFWSKNEHLKAQSLVGRLADSLALDATDPHPFDIYRLWASSYFAEEVETARTIMDRLLEHERTGWLFTEEYLDLFGNPASEKSQVADLVYWRDLFTSKAHHAHALELNEAIMEARHHPKDYLVHAGILLAQGERLEACAWVKKAESYGFLPPDESDLRSVCASDPKE